MGILSEEGGAGYEFTLMETYIDGCIHTYIHTNIHMAKPMEPYKFSYIFETCLTC